MVQPGASSQLPLIRKFSYGTGHVLNDLCASMWFTYLLIFYHKVLGMNNILAGNLLLVGQIADALATPCVGYESDKINGFCGYGKRKSWHLLGTLCVAASFVFIFSPELTVDPLYYTVGNDYLSFLYYAPFIVIFQFGWASTQISHLSLIPFLASNEHDKVGLNSIRYAFTVMSNLTVYLIAWLLLSHSSQPSAGVQNITPHDYFTFRTLALIVIGTGVVFSTIFHIGTKETTPNGHEDSSSAPIKMNVMCWLKTPQFYVVGVLYMCTRLIVNLSQVYLSMYLTETLMLDKAYIAIVPLVVYLSGFVITFPMKFLSKSLGKKITYTLGLLCVVGACVWFYVLQSDYNNVQYLVMGAGALNGIGGSTLLVLSLSLTADLIDRNVDSAAFVYGAMSFTDKLSNGIAVQVIQIIHPCKASACCAACTPFYRDIMSFVPAACAIVAFVALLLTRPRLTEYTELDSRESSVVANGHSTSYGSVDTRSETLSRSSLLDGSINAS